VFLIETINSKINKKIIPDINFLKKGKYCRVLKWVVKECIINDTMDIVKQSIEFVDRSNRSNVHCIPTTLTT